jgi:hypothetical protein
MTDIDRLHWVVEHYTDPLFHLTRNVGKTFASCHYLAGLLGMVEDGAFIVWDLPKMDWIYHIRPMLAEVLDEYGYETKWVGKYKFQCMGKVVIFLLYDDYYAHRGFDYYLVNTYTETPYYAKMYASGGQGRRGWRNY